MQKHNQTHIREMILLLCMLLSLALFVTSPGWLEGSEAYIGFGARRANPATTTEATEDTSAEATLAPEPAASETAPEAASTPAPTTRALPMDNFEVGSYPLTGGYTESGYEDDTISVKIWKSERTYKAIFSIAEVKIDHPSQLRTAIAGTTAKAMSTRFSLLANRNLGVVSINGDFYSARQNSYVVRQGQLISAKNSSSLDLLIIDYAGDFHIYKAADKAAGVQEMAGNIYQAFSFGPALIIDGAIQTIPDDYSFAATDPYQPRSAIGQIDDLHYVMVVADGRTDYSSGVSCAQLATYMREVLGCTQAFNLDGGASAAMFYQGNIYNHLTNKGERAMNDIIYFASAAEGTP